MAMNGVVSMNGINGRHVLHLSTLRHHRYSPPSPPHPKNAISQPPLHHPQTPLHQILLGPTNPRRLKKLTADKAVEFVKSGMVLGLGTSSTAAFVVARIGELLKSGELTSIVGIPTSKRTGFQLQLRPIPVEANADSQAKCRFPHTQFPKLPNSENPISEVEFKKQGEFPHSSDLDRQDEILKTKKGSRFKMRMMGMD